jgi:hypothetical protein
MARRGRPTGHRLSEESKAKISAGRAGQLHKETTKKKISRSVRRYYKSPDGKLHKQKMSDFANSFWNSEDGLEIRNILGPKMKEHYDRNFR